MDCFSGADRGVGDAGQYEEGALHRHNPATVQDMLLEKDAILHSDRGSQYTSAVFRECSSASAYGGTSVGWVIALTTREWRTSLPRSEREDLPCCRVSPYARRSQEHGVPLCLRLLQPRQGLHAQPVRPASGEVQNLGSENGTGRLTAPFTSSLVFGVIPTAHFLTFSFLDNPWYGVRTSINISYQCRERQHYN